MLDEQDTIKAIREIAVKAKNLECRNCMNRVCNFGHCADDGSDCLKMMELYLGHIIRLCDGYQGYKK